MCEYTTSAVGNQAKISQNWWNIGEKQLWTIFLQGPIHTIFTLKLAFAKMNDKAPVEEHVV